MAFAWDIFAEEIGRVGQRAGARVAQRGIDKRAEERALRMHEEKLKIEEPFKDLSDERITARQKELADYQVVLDKDMTTWNEEFKRGLNIFAGSEGYQKAIERARKEGGMSQVTIMQMEDVIMRLHQGEVPDDEDMAVFEGLDPFDRLSIMDLYKQNKIRKQNYELESAKVANIATRLQNEAVARAERAKGGGISLIDTQRLESGVEDAEEERGDYFSELMNELTGAKEGSKKFIDKNGKLEVTGRNKDVLFDPETGDFNPETLQKLFKKYPQYRERFKRLFKLQGNVMKHKMIKSQFTGGGPTGASNTWTDKEGNVYEIGKVYTIGGKKLKCVGVNDFIDAR